MNLYFYKERKDEESYNIGYKTLPQYVTTKKPKRKVKCEWTSI